MSVIKDNDLCKKLFVVEEEDVISVRNYYKKTQTEIDGECEIIKEWMKQQAHFPDDYDRCRVERLLLRNKFRVERTKQKLENYYTLKGQNHNLLEKMDPRNEAMQAVFTTMWFVPMPKLLNNLDRIFVYRFGKNDNEFSIEANVLLLLGLLELEMVNDYAVGVRFIIDFENLTMTHVKEMELNMIAKAIHLYQECLSGRFLSLEFINLLPMINVIMALFKLCFPEKLYKKIKVHKDLESLKKSIPEEYLPKEYEGKMPSIYEIHENVKELFLQNGEFLMDRVEMVANESKRVGGVKKNELFGVEGTFKKINLD